jgi:hypothetical protein
VTDSVVVRSSDVTAAISAVCERTQAKRRWET